MILVSLCANLPELRQLETKRHRVREHERAQQPASGDAAEEKEKEKRHRLMVRKQEKLLYVCFHVLLNLAEVRPGASTPG